ncbi:MAG: NADPH-dependent oxidoreductase [Snodgrassella sp.]|nr:NADPH-dependent oxidoreductase [Snodgrassella sp.]
MNKLTTTEELLLQRRTVRKFRNQSLTLEQYTRLMEVARQAPTSNFLQQCTIIHVTDMHLREQIRAICQQQYVGANGDLIVFVVDLYRNHRICAQLGLADDALNSTDAFIQGMEDTLIAAQSVVMAAEAMGLGCVYLGSIQNDIRSIIQMLHLPKLTFPLVALQVGVPDQMPELKPRMPLNLRSFENSYQDVFDLNHFAQYDEIVQTYYDLRDSSKHVDPFTQQVASKLSHTCFKRNDILKVIQDQGLCQY